MSQLPTPMPRETRQSIAGSVLAYAARQTNDLAGAVKLYRTALIQSPNQVDTLLVPGRTLFQGGDHAEAIESYNKVLPSHHNVRRRIWARPRLVSGIQAPTSRVEFTRRTAGRSRNVQPSTIRAWHWTC